MGLNNSMPLPATPVTPTILSRHNNRLGAVYLSLHSFWQSRRHALTAPGSGVQASVRKDAYSVVLFHHAVTRSFENDFQRTPENMLQSLLQYEANGGTNYELAVIETEAVMRRHWSSERCVVMGVQNGMLTWTQLRSPVVIFLSDGECNIQDTTIRTLCRAAISLGWVEWSLFPYWFMLATGNPYHSMPFHLVQATSLFDVWLRLHGKSRPLCRQIPLCPQMPMSSRHTTKLWTLYVSFFLCFSRGWCIFMISSGSISGNFPWHSRLSPKDTRCPYSLSLFDSLFDPGVTRWSVIPDLNV